MIDSEEWEKVSPLLDRALEMEPEVRDRWLVELATGDSRLAAAVRELLAEKAAADTGRFLENSPADALGQPGLVGQRIAAYEIDELIGQGGMGSVWLAHRSDGRFEGKAAVKLLNAALIGGPAEQRFVREGSVLAALQHPNIAHLIDAGVSGSGQPYLILEYVEGNSIDDYCEQNRLGIRARLRVFLDVLEAVSYAHRHLVVHRDIKPSNILVTHDGIVKLLDFGIATLLEPASDAQGQREFTREVGAALTPEFAAPEQLLGTAVTTATDIYALGRVLYVLLGGPQARAAGELSAAELLRHTLEHELPLLSEVSVEGSVKRLLRGDLDNILRKALKIDPMERYATVQAFADDLRHHLADEPVSARPDSFGYRAGKFVRRHRGGVLSGTMTALALFAVTIFAVLQMLEAQRQRDEAEAQRQRAEGYSTAITGLLSQAGPGGRPLAPEELLERAVEQVEATYADDPSFLVHMLILISGRYYDLQKTNEEHATLVKAERVARESGDPSLIYQVHCNTVETELAAGRKAEAARRLAEALRLLPAIPDVPALDQAACLRAQSDIAKADGDMSAALEHLEEARGILEKAGRTSGNVYGGILSVLAGYNGEAGNKLKAHDYWLKLVDLNERLGRQDSMPGLIARVSLATSFRNLGQVQRANSLHQAAEADRFATGPGKMLYGEVLSRLGHHDAALELIREALVEVDADGHQIFRIRARFALAQSYFLASRPTEAGQALDDATALMQLDEALHYSLLVDSHRLRADILLATGLADQAANEVSAALRRHQHGRPDDLRLARVLLTGARVALARGKHTEAAESARASRALFEKNTLDPEQSADVGEALLVLAQAESAMGDAFAADRSFARASTSLQNGLGADHPLTLFAKRPGGRTRATADK